MDFRILGPLTVSEGERTLPIAGAKLRALLAILVLNAGRTVSTERLVDLLWGEDPPPTARSSLQVHVSTLRKLLEPGAKEHRKLVTQPSGYTLNLDDDQIDARRFSAMCQQGRERLRAGDAKEAASLLAGALALWHGRPLAGMESESWAVAEVRRLDETRLAAEEDLIEAELELGNHREVVPRLEELVKEHPHRERPRQQLMLAFYRGGQQADASDLYHATRKLLDDELGLEPGPELEALFKRILHQDPTLDLPHDTYADDPPNNLPEQLTAFIDRVDEVTEVGSRLASERLVTLVGFGGIGKTRLAIECARRAFSQNSDGVWFVELGALSNPLLLPSAVASVLGLRENSGETPTAVLTHFLRRRRTLLVFDTCEHLINPVAELAETLLTACPTLRILATSRESLRVAGEVAVRVKPLAFSPVAALPGNETPVVPPAVQLFIDRASRAGDFQPDDIQRAMTICQQLEGIPLAIELAASKLRVLSTEQLAARLQDRFGLLSGGSRNALARHQTLAATIAWSYELLTAIEEYVLSALVSFPGGASLETVESFCLPRDVRAVAAVETLERLADKSLLIVERSELGSRYSMLDTVREYGSNRIRDSGRTEEVGTRLYTWALELARRIEPELRSNTQAQATRRLSIEQRNIAAALEWGLEHRDLDVLELASRLEHYWVATGQFSVGQHFMQRVLSMTSQQPSYWLARSLHANGVMLSQVGRFQDAIKYEEMSVAMFQPLGHQAEMASSLTSLARNFCELGNKAESLSRFEEAVALLRPLGPGWRLAVALNNRALAFHTFGDTSRRPLEWLREAVELAARAGDPYIHLNTLDSLATVEIASGQIDQARQHWLECISIARLTHSNAEFATILDGFVYVATALGQHEVAITLAAAGATLRSQIGAVRPLLPAFEEMLRTARGHLDGTAARLAWTAGQGMSWAEAIALAQERLGLSLTLSASPSGDAG